MICTSYLLLYNKLPLQHNGWKQQTFIIWQGFGGSEIWEQLSWLVLARDLSWGFSQVVSWGCSQLKACLGLEDTFQDGSITWLLAEILSTSPHGCLSILRQLASPRTSDPRRKNKQEAILPFITKTLKSHTIIFTLFFRDKSLRPTHSWREQGQRICRHLKTCTTIHGLLFALQFQWRQWSYHFPYPGTVPLFFISFSQNLKDFIHYYSSCIFNISLSSLCFPSAFKHFLSLLHIPF